MSNSVQLFLGAAAFFLILAGFAFVVRACAYWIQENGKDHEDHRLL